MTSQLNHHHPGRQERNSSPQYCRASALTEHTMGGSRGSQSDHGEGGWGGGGACGGQGKESELSSEGSKKPWKGFKQRSQMHRLVL